MKAVSWIMALTLAVSAHAQKVITVRPQHSKVLINTLRANENIVRGETRLAPENRRRTVRILNAGKSNVPALRK